MLNDVSVKSYFSCEKKVIQLVICTLTSVVFFLFRAVNHLIEANVQMMLKCHKLAAVNQVL